jgi:hypothetical protein
MAAALGLISFKNSIGLVIRARLFEKDERRTRVAAKKEPKKEGGSKDDCKAAASIHPRCKV